MKSYRLIVAKRAKDDVAEAVVYYNTLQKGLGNRFKKTFKAAIQTIWKTPFFQIRYKEFRVVQIKKFPYLIHYNVDANAKEIIILAIICTHRNPNEHWL